MIVLEPETERMECRVLGFEEATGKEQEITSPHYTSEQNQPGGSLMSELRDGIGIPAVVSHS
jgi:hypothetical protein